MHNFEVNIKEKKEVAYASGIRGIRALKLQRDVLQNQEQFDQEIMTATKNRFFDAEQRAAARKQDMLKRK